MADSASANSVQGNRLRLRLNLTKASLYGLLSVSGVVFLFSTWFSNAGIWLPASQVLLAAGLVALAFTENSLRCAGGTLPAEAEDDRQLSPETRRWLPPEVQAWLSYVHQHLATTAVSALLALCFAAANFAPGVTFSAAGTLISRVIPGALVLLCFGLLVIERKLSFNPLRHWRYQREHIGLVRVMMSVLLALAAGLFLSPDAPRLAGCLIKFSTLPVMLMSLEYFLRVLIAMITPTPADGAPRFHTHSAVAALYRWPVRPVTLAVDSLEQRFGIDLRQIQAFRMMGKTILPVTCGMLMLSWLLTGITEIQVYQRGIYERFGRPLKVLTPGLHVGLPWPLGHVRMVENGVVHELQLSDGQVKAGREAEPDTAEGPAPQSSWRLWDNSHLTDWSQVIASRTADGQSFQIVNMDIRLIWRIGPSDDDALNSQYRAEDLPVLIRRIARQILVTHFASKQLDALLDEQRADLARTLNEQIQQRLTTLHSGVEVLSTRIEAIHPPAGAADAYHGVQAAQIAARARVEREKGYATTVTSTARQAAEGDIDNAQANAAERMSRASAAATQFMADRQTWHQAGRSFLLERRYRILSQALAHTPLLILDSRLQGTSEPVLDMRPYPAIADSTAPQKASTK
ncbi:SPFH domain-containing protein [Enterobacter wuhouensis]|uniref:SPFH domain-containing protein n=1 Tax=Enterobacter wuhouensis TaxID=2529381 RepID=UPI002FD17E5B